MSQYLSKKNNHNNKQTKAKGFASIGDVISKKIKKPDFRIFGIQKKCVDCEKVFSEEFKINNINIVNINKNILTISCKSKTVSNEIQLIRKKIIEKIKKNTGTNILDIKII